MRRFVTIKRYSELSGYTQEAIRQKIKKGVWRLQKHVYRAPDGRLMINVEEVEKWIVSCQEA
ncbi:excisionase [Saccharospirillum sp. MSK14-1]|uniref:excisionase n=1 Tax=Saccharospirillum sp. MSK14-1 TaxID=1897632 RepID=UPI000D35694A|nr:excisionase [Saccharospirillum sp. MSK14-1]PTY38076.1 excisionase [Saccharospirillum sp. MSK14-1]